MCLRESGPVPVLGWIVELGEDELVLGTASFVRVEGAAVSLSAPGSWSLKPRDLPGLEACQSEWKKAREKELLSSEAEALTGSMGPERRTSRGLSSDFANLNGLFQVAFEDNEEDDEDEYDFCPPSRVLAVFFHLEE